MIFDSDCAVRSAVLSFSGVSCRSVGDVSLLFVCFEMLVKFIEISKTATSLLNDDYQTNGYQLKAKQKTSCDGAVLTTTIDVFGKDSITTPGILTWTIREPLGLAGFSTDELEVDKSTKFRLGTPMGKALHIVPDLKIEAKSDLVGASKIVARVQRASVMKGLALEGSVAREVCGCTCKGTCCAAALAVKSKLFDKA